MSSGDHVRLWKLGDPSGIPIGTEPITIGAGPRSDIRVDGVKPLCCVITRRGDKIVARRWADGVLLNGAAFTEQALTIGDGLTVGPVTLELLRDESSSGPEHRDSNPNTPGEALAVEPVDGLGGEEQADHDLGAGRATAPPASEENEDADRLRARLAASKGRLRSIVASLRDARSRADRDARDAADHVETLQSALAAAEQRCAEMLEANEALRTDVEATQGRVEASSLQVRRAEEQLSGLSAIEERCAELTETNAALRDEVAAAQSRAAALESEIGETREGLTELTAVERRCDDLTESNATLRDEIQAAQDRMVALESEAEDARDRVAELTVSNASLCDEITSIQACAEALELEAQDARQRVAELDNAEQRCAELVADNSALREGIEATQQRVEALETELLQAQHQADAADGIDLAGETAVDRVEDSTDESAVNDRSAFGLWDSTDESGGVEDRDAEVDAEAAERPASTADEHPAAETPSVAEPSDESFEGTPETTAELDEYTYADPEALKPAAEDEPLWAIEKSASDPASSESSHEVAPADETPVEDADLDAADSFTEQALESSPEPELRPTELETDSTRAPEPADLFAEPPETESSGQAESFYDRYAHLLPDDDSEVPSTPFVAPAPISAEATDAPIDGAADDDEGSIDDYLQQMMERIRGGPTPTESDEDSAEPIEEEALDPVAETVRFGHEPAEPLLDLEQITPRDAPERTADMGSLRQLANESARDAFVVADSNETKEQAVRRLVIAGGAALGGAIACFTAPTLLGWRMLVGIGGVLLGAQLAFQTLRDLQRIVSEETPVERVEESS